MNKQEKREWTQKRLTDDLENSNKDNLGGDSGFIVWIEAGESFCFFGADSTYRFGSAADCVWMLEDEDLDEIFAEHYEEEFDEEFEEEVA